MIRWQLLGIAVSIGGAIICKFSIAGIIVVVAGIGMILWARNEYDKYVIARANEAIKRAREWRRVAERRKVENNALKENIREKERKLSKAAEVLYKLGYIEK